VGVGMDGEVDGDVVAQDNQVPSSRQYQKDLSPIWHVASRYKKYNKEF
jgi:hypothetical protein